MKIRDIFHLLAGRTLCLLCGSFDYDSLHMGLCRDCLSELEKESLLGNGETRNCRCCGIRLLSEMDLCTECRRYPTNQRNMALFSYHGKAGDLIQFYKFQSEKRLYLFFAGQIDRALRHESLIDYALLPVPPSRKKIFKTGWDQMELIGSELKRLGWPLIHPLAKKEGLSQKKLSREEREREIIGRYYLKRSKKGLPEKIILLDDVYTTGATLRECTRILKAEGAEDVRSLTIARD
ncbi:MAG: ComF family protein [Spirochaetales bacterium]|nr:ComF family protein [Spirochaetales bacterium]